MAGVLGGTSQGGPGLMVSPYGSVSRSCASSGEWSRLLDLPEIIYIKVYLKISSYYETGVKKFIKHLFGKLKMEKILASDSNAVVFFIITGINFP